MNRASTWLMLLLMVGVVRGAEPTTQVSDAEYLLKLDEFKKKTATRPTASEAKSIAWKLKEGAPPAVVAWVNALERMKSQQVTELLGELWYLERLGAKRTGEQARRRELVARTPAQKASRRVSTRPLTRSLGRHRLQVRKSPYRSIPFPSKIASVNRVVITWFL